MRICSVVFLLFALCSFSLAQPAMPAFPLKVSLDGHYFVDQNGEPFLLFSDTAWELFTMTTQAEAEEYLEARKGQGFNAVTVTLAPATTYSVTKAGGDLAFFPKGKLDNPTEAYLRHAEWVIDKAAEKGMLVLLISFYSGCCPSDFHYWWPYFTKEVARPFGALVGERFKHKQNVLWIHGLDAPPGAKAALFGDMAQAIDSAGGPYLQTYQVRPHDPVFPNNYNYAEESSAAFFSQEGWLDFNTVTSWTNNGTAMVLKDYRRTPAKPVYFGRGRFEEEATELSPVRAQAYAALLSGAAGHCFGNGVWRFLEGWREWLDTPGAKQMGYVQKLFLGRPWYKLVPDDNHELLVKGYGTPGSGDYVPAARATDGSFALAYLPGGNTIAVDLEKLAGRAVKAGWYNPREGSYQAIGEFSKRSTREFTSPDGQDWVLVLQSTSVRLARL